MNEIIIAFTLLSFIAILIFIEKKKIRKDYEKSENERKKRWEERRESLRKLTDDDIKELDAKLKNDKLDFISALESGYEIREYQFPTFKAKSGNGLRKKSLGYLKIEQDCDRIAAFVFNSLPDIGELNSMTLNLNGMVSRRFEGYEEYLKIREFDIKTGDLITVEIEFDSSEPFKLDGLAILFLKKKVKGRSPGPSKLISE